ncbi:glutathione S-transferase [Sphingomonas sp. SRS2]|uniref:glutathione S-transferase n=1 Tax=Sphingomonas sp. SRS2 TaxID=133190 RepID=UPI0006184DE0|nr:glutathione S-transferase [Sphingomonas sp. SRS2]KKC26279.1 glutathione S-transferase [Sphingomonas sp. SRS2]
MSAEDLRPILYSFRRCPYAMRARLALLASGTVCEIREVKLSAKPAELAAASPKATVPVLVLADGRVIDQSLDIMRWALSRNDPEGWLTRADEALIATNDGPFKHHLDRYKYPHRHQSDPAEHRAAGLAMLETLESRLEASSCLSGAARGITDAAIFPFIRQFAEPDRLWFDAQKLPRLHAWLVAHLAWPLFETAMVRLDPWRTDDAPRLFPG